MSVRSKPDAVLLALVALALIGAVGAMSARAPEGRPAAAMATLRKPTVTPSPTAGWWGKVTPGPYGLHPMPTLPRVGIHGVEGKEGVRRVPFSLVSCPTDGVAIETITEPRPGWWNVYGTAAIPNLWYWKAELSPDGSHWSGLYSSGVPVAHGLLVEFRTDTVQPGSYLMRLTAVDRTGNYPKPCVVRVEVK